MEPRMEKYQLTREEILGVIDRAECAVVCTNNDDGYPYGTPVNMVRIGERLYFHGRSKGTRTSNILRDPRCSVTFTEELGYDCAGDCACDTETLFRSVIVFGRMSVVEDEASKREVLSALTEKLIPGRTADGMPPDRIERTGVYEIVIESMTGKYRNASPDGVFHGSAHVVQTTNPFKSGWDSLYSILMQPNMQKYPLTEEQMDALLDRARMGVISTIGEDGYPYGTPVNFVVMDGRIFFHGRKVGEKVSNLKRDPRCCFTVVDEKGFERCGDGACDTTSLYESVIIRGKVSIIDDDDLKMRILRATVDKLTPERRMDEIDAKKVPPTGIFEIVPESRTGKYHSAEPGHKIYQ